MKTLRVQVQDDTYQELVDKGIDIQTQVKQFINDLLDDGYQSIPTDEAKKRVSSAVSAYYEGTLETIPHDAIWDSIETDCKIKSANSL